MNAERLHEICVDTRDAITSGSLVDLLHGVTGALQETVNQPQSPERQQELSTALETLYNALRDFPTDQFSPAWKEVLDEIAASDVLGERLAARVREVVERNQITPATAQQEVSGIAGELDAFVSAIDQLISAFAQLHIGRDDLQPGECELGVLIPRSAVDDGFGEFVGELGDLDFIFGTFSELVSADASELQIRTISSSDLMVFLAAVPGVCASIAYGAERITGAYKNLLEIKKLRRELKEQGLPAKSLKGIDTHANKVMAGEIEGLTIEIVDEYYVGDDVARRNELTNAVRISLRKLANKIDRGFNIEVRAEQPGPSTEDADDESHETLSHHIQVVMDASQTLRFIRPEGEPILHLPEATKPAKPSGQPGSQSPSPPEEE